MVNLVKLWLCDVRISEQLVLLPIYRADTGNIIRRTNSFCQKSVAYLPSKHSRTLLLVTTDSVHNFWSGNLGFGAPYHPSFERPRLIVPGVQRMERKLLAYLLIELTLGTFSWEQVPSASSLSLISHANIVGFSCLKLHIWSTTLGVATLGFEPPITPGLMEPVS